MLWVVVRLQHPKFIDVGSSTAITSAERGSGPDSTERSRTTRLDVPLVGIFDVESRQLTSAISSAFVSTDEEGSGHNGRVGHSGCGHPATPSAAADRNSDSTMMDAHNARLEDAMRGESDATPDIHMSIAEDDPTRGRVAAVRFDANVGGGSSLGTELNSEGSPTKRRRTIRFFDEV